MFGVLVDYGDDGRVFKVFSTREEADEKMNNCVCMGYTVTLFDYDKDSDEYLEFYSM